SPLIWDVFAVSTYATVSLLFWFVGLIPDLATLRDRSQSRVGRVIYGMLAMGWRGSALHWHRYETAYLLLAGLATPLVVSVHTVVSFDFAISIVPGWHTTSFPPYFVAGAIYSGFANVLTPQFLWLKRVRTSVPVLFLISLIVNVGMWLERFVIVVTSLHRDFLPSSWGMFSPTIWDWATYVGTIGLFLTLLFLFLRFL